MLPRQTRDTESLDRFDQLIGEWLSRGRHGPPVGSGITISELLAAYWSHADGYYRKNGEPTVEIAKLRAALRPLKRLYGRSPAESFGPLALRTVRDEFVASGFCRRHVNDQTNRIRRVFKWAVERELVPPSVHHGLQAVSGLKRGRSDAHETDPVRPVPDEHVDAIKPHVSKQVWAIIELQRLRRDLSLCRPSALCLSRKKCLHAACVARKLPER